MSWFEPGEAKQYRDKRGMQTRKVLSKLNLLVTKNYREQGQAAEASFYSQVNGSY
jgi:hypothetical protein